MAGVIIPNTYVKEINDPVIMLLGPIRGAPNWQDEAIDILFGIKPDLVIVTPRRGVRDSFAKYVLPGDENHFSRQRAWEIHYTEMASEEERMEEKGGQGCAMFWLPGEEEHRCEKVYGAISREEFGLMLGNYRHNYYLRFCVGTDGNFPEWRTHLYTLNNYAPEREVFDSLEDTCREAVRMAAVGI